MIRVHISRDNRNNILGYSVEGHANAAEHGQDIVCASISILAQTTVLALHELLNINIVFEIEDGWLSCEIPGNLSKDLQEKANLILNTMLIGVKGTQGMYSRYIELHDEEV